MRRIRRIKIKIGRGGGIYINEGREEVIYEK